MYKKNFLILIVTINSFNLIGQKILKDTIMHEINPENTRLFEARRAITPPYISDSLMIKSQRVVFDKKFITYFFFKSSNIKYDISDQFVDQYRNTFCDISVRLYASGNTRDASIYYRKSPYIDKANTGYNTFLNPDSVLEYYDQKPMVLRMASNKKSTKLYTKEVKYYKSGQIEELSNFIKQNKNIYAHYYHGDFIKYRENGNIVSVQHYELNQLKGIQKTYYDNGQLKISYDLDIGNKWINVLEYYDINGNSLKVGTFKDGEGVLIDYYDNGQIKKYEEYKNGQLFNILEYKDINGNPLALGSFKNGKGKLFIYDESGNLVDKKRF